MKCDNCSVTVLGDWSVCPFCYGALTGEIREAPLPDIALRYDRKRLITGFGVASFLLIVSSIVAARLLAEPIGVFAIVWFAVAAVWSLVMLMVRKRRNFAKAIVYAVALISLLVLYADHWQGWRGWSVDWVIPLVSSTAILTILVVVRIVRMRVADYIIYLWSAAILGLAPVVFLIVGWTEYSVPTWVSLGLAVLAAGLALLLHRSETANELRKRFSI